jgi:hypothetical protein
MKRWAENLWESFGGRRREREIDDELRFHLDLLTQDLISADMPYPQAEQVARARFGDFAQVRKQCVAIRRRTSPLNRALKLFLVIVVVCGFLIRVAGPDYRVARIGGILIFIGLVARLFLYLRGLAASTSVRTDFLSSLVLNEPTFRDNRQDLTPLERVFKQ